MVGVEEGSLGVGEVDIDGIWDKEGPAEGSNDKEGAFDVDGISDKEGLDDGESEAVGSFERDGYGELVGEHPRLALLAFDALLALDVGPAGEDDTDGASVGLLEVEG